MRALFFKGFAAKGIIGDFLGPNVGYVHISPILDWSKDSQRSFSSVNLKICRPFLSD